MSEHCTVVRGKLALPYKYFAGRMGSRFLVALRDRRQILGVRCERCDKVFVPPRQTCEGCWQDLSDSFVELTGEGEITNFTVVRYSDRHLPRQGPYVLALIRLDGADTPLAHLVEAAPEAVRVGMRVRAVYGAEASGTILDIAHFAPLGE